MDIFDVILKALKETGIPDLDLRPGSGIYTFLVRGSSLIYQAFSAIANRAFENNIYLENYQNLPEDIVDRIVSNYLIKRRVGDYARGIVRVYFADPRDIVVTEAIYAVTADGRRYFATNNRRYSRSEIASQYDVTLGLYYLDLVVEAEERGTSYNIPAGTITAVFNIGEYITVTNPDDIRTEAEHETNEQLVARVKTALTLRGLVNSSAIITTLFEQFPEIGDIAVVNYGDPEMWRDLFQGVHMGGKVDVYVDLARMPNTLDTYTVNTGTFYSADNPPKAYTLNYIEVADIDLLPPVVIQSTDGLIELRGGSTSLYGDGDYDSYMYEYVFGFDNLIIEPVEDGTYKAEHIGSSRQKVRLWFSPFLGSSVRLGGYKIASQDINAFLSDPTNRPVTCDMIAKHFWYVYVIIRAQLLYGDPVAVRQAIIDYITQLKTSLPDLGELIAYVESHVPNVGLKIPFDDFSLRLWNDRYELEVISYPWPRYLIGLRHMKFLPGTEDPFMGEDGVVIYV